MTTDFENSFPGYTQADLPEEEALVGTDGWTSERWKEEFSRTRLRLVSFLDARDPYVILARSASRLLSEPVKARSSLRRLEQAEVEMIQTLLLASQAPVLSVPTSPGNFVRLWLLMSRHMRAFMAREPVKEGWDSLGHRIRFLTLYYRNPMERSDCERLMAAILSRIDQSSRNAIGYQLSALYGAMGRIFDLVAERHAYFWQQLGVLLHSTDGKKVDAAVAFFRDAYPLASRAWRDSRPRFAELQHLRTAAFQMSELAYPWIFTLSRELLESEFGADIATALFELSHSKGDLADHKPEHVYLDNPIWTKPYIRLSDDALFVALPQLAYSFPFAIVERLIAGHEGLRKAYETARAECLESEVERVVQTTLPSASVYRGVQWDEAKSGKTWENDIIAQLGNFLFVFEAKSGRLHDIARRGGSYSLKTNFEELFIEPGIQGWRLQTYIDENGTSAAFRLKRDGSRVDFGLDKPKVVYRFSVCIEHFAHLTSARHNLKQLGLIEDDAAWAPVLSLGELGMISRHLDSEAAAQHYLTRRATLEQMLDFEGDEQDLLSLYLTNGFWFDPSTLDGAMLRFFEADTPVRIPKTPRNDRAIFEAPLPLSPLWRAVCGELYADVNNRHHFDMLNVVLNQNPGILTEFEKRIRKFRRGVPLNGEDTMWTHVLIGKRTFVLACHLAKALPDPKQWPEVGRTIAGQFFDPGHSIDCAVFLFAKRSREQGYDGFSFLRATEASTLH